MHKEMMMVSGRVPGSDMAIFRWKAVLEDVVSPQEVSMSTLWGIHIPMLSVVVGNFWKPIAALKHGHPVEKNTEETNEIQEFIKKVGHSRAPRGVNWVRREPQQGAILSMFCVYMECKLKMIFS